MKQLTEDEFDTIYSEDNLIKNTIGDNGSHNGCMFETYGEELEFVVSMAKEKRVITILEGEDDERGNAVQYYTSGLYVVNRIGYLITKEPITEEFESKMVIDIN